MQEQEEQQQQQLTNIFERTRIKTRINRSMLTIRVQIENIRSTKEKTKEPKQI
jgi:hypothetical protein